MRTRTTLTCLIALVAVASAVPGVAQTTDELARAQLAKGEERLAAGDLLSAESELRKTIEEFPSTEWAHWARVRLADCLLRQNRLDESINVARGVVNVCPASSPRLAAAWAQYYVGLGYKAKDELDAQIWEMEKVESILGDHEDRGPFIKAKYELALAHHNRNDREKSISLCHEILSEKNATDDDRAWACVILGSSLADSGKTDEALSVLDRVRNEFPSLQEQVLAAERRIFENRYLSRHDYDGAIREGRAIASSPTSSEGRARQARYYTALALLRKGDYQEAILEAQALLDRYTVFGEDHRKCRVIIARASAARKDYANAVAALQALLATDPPDTETRATALWDIATCCKATGDTARAREYYQRIIDACGTSHLALRAARELAG